MKQRDKRGRFIKKNSGFVSQIFHWIKGNNDQLKLLFAILAGLYAISEYRSKDYFDRVKNSVEAIDKFYANDAYNHLIKIEDFWLTLADKRKLLESGKLDPTEFRNYVHQESKNYRQDFLKVLRSFKIISICAIQGRCEPATICIHLTQMIQDFRCNFREYLAELSEENGSCILDEVNYFVDLYCRDWIASYMGVPEYSGIKDNICLYDKNNKKSKLGNKCSISIIHKKNYTFFTRFLE